jgi:hydrogenase nickel incorporation protein HypB
MEIKIMKNIMSSNIELAEKNKDFFKENNICAINVMASPGAGKTSVIIELIKKLSKYTEVNVIEGDIASSIDSEKIENMGYKVMQINTGGGCHLDANMIKEGIHALDPAKDSIIFIENVGNLVCPSSFDLGESLKMVISSVPEGDDKPYKYLSMFENADLVVLNKIDLMPYIDFNKDSFINGIKALNPNAPIYEVSCQTGEGIKEVIDFFIKKINA